MRYTVLIDGEPGGYGVVFPDLPGCTAMGDTVEAALTDAASAVRDWARVTELHGGTVPPARDLATLRQDPEVAEALAEGAALGTVVLIRDAGRPVKANLSLDAGTLAAIDEAAKRIGETRSGAIRRLAEVGIPLLG